MATAGDEHLVAESPEWTNMISKPLLEFTSKIFKPFASKENVVLSPISIHKGLSMVLLGADNGTQTRDELLETLGLKGLKEEEISKCLDEYSNLIAKFKKITKESLELYKERERKTDDERYDRFAHQKPPILDIFNMVITKDQGDILPAYEQKVTKYFDSSIIKLDDKKPETKSNLLTKLNEWGREAGFDQPIVRQQELDEKFSAFLLSAIRVQGFWFNDFTEHNRNSTIFYNHGKKDQPVKGPVLVNSELSRTRYLELTLADKAQHKFLRESMSKSESARLFEELSTLNMRVVEVPLQGNLAFAIFEPLNPSASGGELDKLVEQLMQADKSSPASNKFVKVLSLLDSELGAQRVHAITMPKFGFENEINLKEHLQSIGLQRAFNRMTAEISNMTTNKLFIDKITHQAVFEVTKFGIKAAGVTKIKLKLLSSMHTIDPINVQIQNPFLFTIRYGKLPLFIGRLDSLK